MYRFRTHYKHTIFSDALSQKYSAILFIGLFVQLKDKLDFCRERIDRNLDAKSLKNTNSQ